MKTLEEIRGQTGLRIVEVAPDGGAGLIEHGKLKGSVIWSFGGGWEHVSIHPFKRHYVPSWDEMCWLKSLFFYAEEWAVQYHPPVSEYVNNLGNCLHIWRPINQELPTPPSWMTGAKQGQTLSEAYAEGMKELQDGNSM